MNGFHFCSYAYRVMRLKIQTVQINGDVLVDTLEYRMVDKYPEKMPNQEDTIFSVLPEHPLSESMSDKVVSNSCYFILLGFSFIFLSYKMRGDN